MPLSYIGGKSRISAFITPFYPKDMEIYCEPFSGMYWCFFNLNLEEYPNLKKIVYNDFNPLNYNLFRCVKDHQKLLQECNKIYVQEKDVFPTNPICKQNFENFQRELYSESFTLSTQPDYEVAAKYAYVLSQVFSGAKPEKAKFIDLKGKYHSKFTSFKNKLENPKWQKLFESITHQENMDFEAVIKKYDSEKTYFYVDPPYYIVGEGTYYSKHSFNRNDHERLADCLKSIKGRFSLSYYDFPQLSEWFPKDQYHWESKEFVKAAAAKKGAKQTKGEEILIMNY